MKKVIKLTESDLVKIIKKVIRESDDLPPSKPPHDIKDILNQIELNQYFKIYSIQKWILTLTYKCGLVVCQSTVMILFI